mgnify:CR=1 FL=1
MKDVGRVVNEGVRVPGEDPGVELPVRAAHDTLVQGVQAIAKAAPATSGPPEAVANPALRALIVALDEWVTDGKAPPPSRVPRLADNTLVTPKDLGHQDIRTSLVYAKADTGVLQQAVDKLNL